MGDRLLALTHRGKVKYRVVRLSDRGGWEKVADYADLVNANQIKEPLPGAVYGVQALDLVTSRFIRFVWKQVLIPSGVPPLTSPGTQKQSLI